MLSKSDITLACTLDRLPRTIWIDRFEPFNLITKFHWVKKVILHQELVFSGFVAVFRTFRLHVVSSKSV